MTDRGSGWIHVRYSKVSESQDEKKHGVTIRVMTSPLDVPDMWRHEIRQNAHGKYEVVFEFRYLSSPESLRTLEEGGIRLEIGKNSKRIYLMVIPMLANADTGDEVQINLDIHKVEEKIEAWEKDKDLRPAHANVIQNFLKQNDLQLAF